MFFSGAFFSAGNWYRLCASLKKSRQWLCSEITSLLIPLPVGHTINLQELLLSFDASSSFFFHYPRAHHVTCIYLPTNNGLLKRNVVQLCFAANNLLLIRKKQRTFLLLAIAFAWKWQNGRYSLLNSVIAKYRDFSVSSRRSIMICSSLTNHHILLNLVQ